MENSIIPNKFIIEESNFCDKRPNLKVIVFVHSAIKAQDKRNITRFTWGLNNPKNASLATVFMVGNPKDEKENNILTSESLKYHDIVQGNYTDAYKNLTYKALNALLWIIKNCPYVPWTMHADDDIMVNTNYLVKYIENDENYEKDSFHCNVHYKSKVLRKGKWKVFKKEYSKKMYPPYCLGPFWLVPTRILPNLLHAALNSKFLWVDDVYLTGILAKSANISHIKMRNIHISFRKKKEKYKMIAWLSTKKDDRVQWWKEINEVLLCGKLNTTCNEIRN